MDGISYVRQFYMHSAVRPRIMLIGIQGSSEYGIMSNINKPDAVYPTWSGKNDEWSELVDFIEHPWGENEELCNDESINKALRPVFGQKHRVVIHNSPAIVSGVGKKFWLTVDRVQSDYPEVELFINGTRSYSNLFGLDWKAVDYGLCDAGDVNNWFHLPSGILIDFDEPRATERLFQWESWIRMLGFTPQEIVADQRRRYAFRIRSARWANKHFRDNFRFHIKHLNVTPDEAMISDGKYVPPPSRSIILRRKLYTTKEADKALCDRCRIAPGCKMYRADSICGLPKKEGNEMGELVDYFQSRNASKVVDGLAYLTRLQARRLESAMEKESNEEDLDPEVTKQMNSLFSNGVKLAKLVDPQLAGPGTKVQVNVGTGGNAQVVASTNPKEMMAAIVGALEDAGVAREDITPQMVKGLLVSLGSSSPQNAIEAAKVLAEKSKKSKEPKVIDAAPSLPAVFSDDAGTRA